MKKHPLDPEVPFLDVFEDIAWRIQNEAKYTPEELAKIQADWIAENQQ
jgi:hypothetical protein